MTIAIIPARGGSKRIPRKNIRPFAGRPMICWSIDAAQASRCFKRIVVSTDDEEIAEVARSAGADVPFRRPPELADDRAETLPVIAHAINWLRADGEVFDEVCCIYATAPMLSAADLVEGRRILRDRVVDYAFGCASFAFPVQRALVRDEHGRVAPMFPEFINFRSQDLIEAFHDAGQFYWGRADAFTSRTPIFGPTSVAIRVPRHRVQDIDTEEDWARAEFLFRANKDA